MIRFLLIMLLTVSSALADRSCFDRGLTRLLGEERVSLPQTPTEYQQFYRSAERNMRERVDFKNLTKIVRNIARGKLTQISPELAKELKLERAEGLKVRASYRLFTRDHKPPKKFGTFVTNFGLLNDSIESGDNLLRERAKVLLRQLEDKDWDTSRYDLKPARGGELPTYLNGVMTKLSASLSQPMHIEEFHDIRKRVREFRVLFQALASHGDSPALRDIGEEAGRLSDDMGDFKDAYMTAGKDPHLRFTMPEEFQSRARALFERCRNITQP